MAWIRLTISSWEGAGTPHFFEARTTDPLMVSTSVFRPSLKSAQMEVTPSGDYTEV